MMLATEALRTLTIVFWCGVWVYTVTEAGNAFRTHIYNITTDARCPGSTNDTPVTSISQIECTSRCYMNDGCVSVNFEPLTGTCEQCPPPIYQTPSPALGWRNIITVVQDELPPTFRPNKVDMTQATAWQTSTIWDGDAPKAIDGDNNTWYHAGSCTSTNTDIQHNYWAVELAGVMHLVGVNIYFRSTHSFRNKNLRFSVSMSRQDAEDSIGTEVGFIPLYELSNPLKLEFPIVAAGKVFKISQESVDGLTLCEVILLTFDKQ